MISISINAQPNAFTWKSSSNKDYISPAKDQGTQGPCHIFAAVAAVEAMCQIYYNKSQTSSEIDLSEAEIYSPCSGYGCVMGPADISQTFTYVGTNGIVDDDCFEYPDEYPFCRPICNPCSIPQYEVTIPGYQQLYLSTNQQLKRAIIDYGPIAVTMEDCSYELHGDANDLTHSVLIVGWNSLGRWHIKDSWPGGPTIDYKNIDVFSQEFNTLFFRAKYKNGASTISCSGSGCSSVFSSRTCVDSDEDGFYNWGIGDKPNGCSGPCLMDFDDDDPEKLYLDDDYNIVVDIPYITGPDLICGYDSFTFHNTLSEDFEIEGWELYPWDYFYSPASGDDDSVAYANPRPEYIGKTCTITFTISDGCGEVEYSKNFIINGPEEELVTIEVEDSYGNPPPQYSGVWLLCPNTNYYVFIENDSDCDIYDYEWIKPAGWSQYYAYDNYISINSGSNPTGTLQVKACTCCEGDNCSSNDKVVVKTQYFSQYYNCGGYFMYYPNPASTEINIELSEDVDLKEKDIALEIYDSGSNKIYLKEKVQKKMKIKTDAWKNDFYYIVLKYKGKVYSEKIKVEK